MPTYIRGNLWGELGRAQAIFVTTNSSVNGKGHLVMGRGAAKEAAQRFPDLPRRAADMLYTMLPLGERRQPRLYGLQVIGPVPPSTKTDIGLFQVKWRWHETAELGLIGYSTAQLLQYVQRQHMQGLYDPIAMNMPGTGYGGLPREAVLPYLACLPPEVRIYEYPG